MIFIQTAGCLTSPLCRGVRFCTFSSDSVLVDADEGQNSLPKVKAYRVIFIISLFSTFRVTSGLRPQICPPFRQVLWMGSSVLGRAPSEVTELALVWENVGSAFAVPTAPGQVLPGRVVTPGHFRSLLQGKARALRLEKREPELLSAWQPKTGPPRSLPTARSGAPTVPCLFFPESVLSFKGKVGVFDFFLTFENHLAVHSTHI